MSDFKPLLMKIKIFWFKRFKNHDRIYFISPEDKLRLNCDLRYHIGEIKDLELRSHIINSSILLKKGERLNWEKMEELSA